MRKSFLVVGGVVDAFEAEGLRVFGPRNKAAILEGSKAISKDLMKKYNIPTAAYETFTDESAALAYLEKADFPIVLKADGLALGKGVLICNTLEEAKDGVKTIMEDKKFGDSGNEIVIEEFLEGPEVSVLSFTDGKTVVPMVSSMDHKRSIRKKWMHSVKNISIRQRSMRWQQKEESSKALSSSD